MLRLFIIWMLSASIVTAGGWKLERIEGRDYVSLENLAKFYGLASPEKAQESDVKPASYQVPGLPSGQGQIGVKVNSREATINGVKQWLSFPVREKDGQILISRMDLATTIEPMLRPQRIANLKPVETVVIDPGHGGADKGAISGNGMEKQYALDVSLRLKTYLEEKGVNVVMTRSSDVFIPLDKRPEVANKLPNSIFVSVHFNAAKTNANGFEVFALTPRGAPSTSDQSLSPRHFRNEPGNSVDVPSVALASSVYHAMLGHFTEFDRGLKRARFAVLRQAKVPAILVEGGFLSNKEEAKNIHKQEWRQKLAESIGRGILGFKGLSELQQPPELMADYRREEEKKRHAINEEVKLPTEITPGES